MLKVCLILNAHNSNISSIFFVFRPAFLVFQKEMVTGKTTKCYFLALSDADLVPLFFSFYFRGSWSHGCVTRSLFLRFFLAMITESSRSISIKLSAIVGVDNRIIARRLVCRRRRSINLDLNLSSPWEGVARNPRDPFFRFMASAFQPQFYSFALLRKHALFRNFVAIIQPPSVVIIALSWTEWQFSLNVCSISGAEFLDDLGREVLAPVSRRHKSDS